MVHENLSSARAIKRQPLTTRKAILLLTAAAVGLALLAYATLPRKPLRGGEPSLLGVVEEDPGHPGRFRYEFEVMGTDARLLVCARTVEAARRMIAPAVARIRDVDAAMSTYRPESEISRLNRLGAQQPVELSPMTLSVLRQAVDFSRLTDGAFDVTCAPLRTLWRRAVREGVLPAQEQIDRARRAVGSDKLLLADRAVRFATDGMEVDLGGIAKGFAIELAAQAMGAAGAGSALVDIGGDMRLVGRREDGQNWKIQLRDPRPGEHPPIYLRLADCAVATSGDYARPVHVAGRRFSHIVDPRTGWPVADVPSATIVAPDATTADALATAVSVLGPHEGVELVDSIEGVECMIMARTPGAGPAADEISIYYSEGFPALIEAAPEGRLSPQTPASDSEPGGGTGTRQSLAAEGR